MNSANEIKHNKHEKEFAKTVNAFFPLQKKFFHHKMLRQRNQWEKVVGKQVDHENWKKVKTHKKLLSKVKIEHKKRKEEEEEGNEELENAICGNENITKGNDKEKIIQKTNSWSLFKYIKSLNPLSAFKSFGSFDS